MNTPPTERNENPYKDLWPGLPELPQHGKATPARPNKKRFYKTKRLFIASLAGFSAGAGLAYLLASGKVDLNLRQVRSIWPISALLSPQKTGAKRA